MHQRIRHGKCNESLQDGSRGLCVRPKEASSPRALSLLREGKPRPGAKRWSLEAGEEMGSGGSCRRQDVTHAEAVRRTHEAEVQRAKQVVEPRKRGERVRPHRAVLLGPW